MTSSFKYFSQPQKIERFKLKVKLPVSMEEKVELPVLVEEKVEEEKVELPVLVEEKITYPSYYCNRCSTTFRYKGIERYPHCPRCTSRTSKFNYERGSDTQGVFEKLLSCCPKCRHIWLMEKRKYDLRAHCPKCKCHRSGQAFVWYFRHEIQNKLDLIELRKLLRRRFPMKRDITFRKLNSVGKSEIIYL